MEGLGFRGLQGFTGRKVECRASGLVPNVGT